MFGFSRKKKNPISTGAGHASKNLQPSVTSVPTTLKPAWQEMVNHVYHFPQRLVVDTKEPVKTITGTVTAKSNPPDGDYHIILDNRMECEIICAHKTTQPDAIPYCQNYTNKIPVPNVGDKVEVTGLNVIDECHGPHPELHPVFELKIL